MKAKILLTAFAAIALIAACSPDKKPEGDKFAASLSVGGVTGNTISVPAEAKKVTFTVSSNVSWSITNDSQWITVEPAANSNDTKKAVETTVSVSVAANESEEAREAVLTIGAEGVEAVGVTVKQAGFVKVLEAFDVDKFEAIASPSIALAGINGKASLAIHSNLDWTLTAPEWLTVDPVKWTYDGENDLVVVSFAATTTTAARNGSVKLTADGKELTIPVAQAAAKTISIVALDPPYSYSQIAFKITPETETEYYSYIYAEKSVFDSYGVDGLCEYMVNNRNSYLEKYDAATIISALCYQGTDTYLEEEMEEKTTYVVVVCGIEYIEADKTFVQSTLGASCEITTTEAPVATEAYTAFVGSFKTTACNFFKNENFELTMDVEAYGINDSYLVSFPDGVLTPVYQQYLDRFEVSFDADNGKMVFAPHILGDLGGWSYGDPIGDGAYIVFSAYFYNPNAGEEDEEVAVEEWGFSMGSDNNTLTLFTNPVTPDGQYFIIGGDIYTSELKSSGYANGYAILLSDTFTRVAEAGSFAPLSVKDAALDRAARSLKTFKAAGKAIK